MLIFWYYQKTKCPYFMRVIEFLREKIRPLRGKSRYIGVMIIFFLAIFYNLRIASTNVAVVSDEEKTPHAEVAERIADLDNNIREKVFLGKLDSQNGDYYRVIVHAEANEAARVEIYARTLLGGELKIGDMNLTDDTLSFYESVFVADDTYRDIIVRRAETEKNNGYTWDETKIYIEDISVTRLDIRTTAQAEDLQPTLFGETKRAVQYLSVPAGETGGGFPIDRKQVGQYFETDASALLGVYARFQVIGNGGSGKYEIEVKEDEGNDSQKMSTVGKISFAPDKLWKYKEENTDLYMFEVPVSFEEGRKYYVGIDSSDVTTDERNYLKLTHFGEDKEKEDSFFALSLINYTEIAQGKHLLSDVILQDNGTTYSYDYRMSHTERDLFDVHSSTEKLKFDEKLQMLAVPKGKNASLVYKIDMKYPLNRMHIRTQTFDLKDEDASIDYSYDGTDWKPALNENVKGISSQGTDFYIDGQEDSSTVFLRFRYEGKGNKNKTFGLADLQIMASLKKSNNP